MLIVNKVGCHSLKRYNSAWHLFASFFASNAGWAKYQVVHKFDQIPPRTVALQLLKFSRMQSLSVSCMACSAVCLFPCFTELRFEGMLRNLKKDWFVSVRHYHRFYDL